MTEIMRTSCPVKSPSSDLRDDDFTDGDGVTIPQGIQNTCRCGTCRHDLVVDLAVLVLSLSSVILKLFSILLQSITVYYITLEILEFSIRSIVPSILGLVLFVLIYVFQLLLVELIRATPVISQAFSFISYKLYE